MAPQAAAGVTPFARHLADLIRHDGPMRLDRFMGLANAHYYATRDPLGAAGDFTTAPEISQLFGEMIGLCLVDHWERSGAPSRIHLAELGPGRGTLMADILRAARIRPAFIDAAHIILVETSPTLRARQAETLSAYTARLAWADTFDAIAADAPLYLVANEFFDALPIRQFERHADTWRERFVALNNNDTLHLIATPSPPPVIPGEPAKPPRPGTQGRQAPSLRPLGPGSPLRSGRDDTKVDIFELSEPTQTIAAALGAHLRQTGGLALIIDYGYAHTAFGDTLQAVKSHAYADPLANPGEADLTAHVDFEALARAAAVTAHGPATQGDFLRALGIEARAAALARVRPDQAETLAAGLTRLIAPDQMGTLFKAMALTGPGAPVPAGFGA